VVHISTILAVSIISLLANSLLVLAITKNDFRKLDRVFVDSNHNSFSDALEISLPVYNIEHISSVLKGGAIFVQ
jgi:hypothetical protein